MTIRDLPPLMALRAFEATARLSSFKGAAAELFVTPTAISHQVRQLESHLGFRVLDRTPRSVALTPAGMALYEAVTSSFAEISRVTSHLRRGPAPTILTLSATSSFLSQWLVPRLADLRRALPDLDLRLHADEAAVTLNSGRIDVAIRYGRGPFVGVEATALKADVFAPVCSPKLMISHLYDLRAATSSMLTDGGCRDRRLIGRAGVTRLASRKSTPRPGYASPIASMRCKPLWLARAWQSSAACWRPTRSPQVCWFNHSAKFCAAKPITLSARRDSVFDPTSLRCWAGFKTISAQHSFSHSEMTH